MPDETSDHCDFVGRELALSLDMTIAGKVESISPVVERVMQEVEATGCATGKEFEVQTALQEALANAVVHGCRKDERQQVRIWVGCDKKRGMLIVIRDPGQGFDPEHVPNPIQAQRLYAESGRGIYLINQLMDEVRYEKGGTEIWMHKR